MPVGEISLALCVFICVLFEGIDLKTGWSHVLRSYNACIKGVYKISAIAEDQLTKLYSTL